MSNIDFLSCGQVGDLIHQLYVVKSICIEKNVKANLYIAELSYGLCACGNFTFDLNKTYEDTKELINSQDYINKYEILPINFDLPIINLNIWRDMGNFRSWTTLLSETFNVNKLTPNKWVNSFKVDENTKGKVLIHNSDKRHNSNFPWVRILDEINDEILFITSNQSEYDGFRFKTDKVKLYLTPTVGDMVNAINSSKLFIGNQSLPLAIASSLDVLRIAELHPSSGEFYNGEHQYSSKISWFISDVTKHNSDEITIKI